MFRSSSRFLRAALISRMSWSARTTYGISRAFATRTKRGSLVFPSHPTTEIPSRFTSIPSARKAGAHGHAANRERDVWAHYHTNPVGDRTRVAEKLRSGTQFRAKSSKPGFRSPPGAALADLGGRPATAFAYLLIRSSRITTAQGCCARFAPPCSAPDCPCPVPAND